MTVFRDLSQHILDIAENSITAGATLLHVDIEEDPVVDRLAISVRDNGRGMAPEMLLRVADPWVTTRTTRKVGLGIPFLKQTAEMCGGDFEIISAPGAGTTIQATLQFSHIDRRPWEIWRGRCSASSWAIPSSIWSIRIGWGRRSLSLTHARFAGFWGRRCLCRIPGSWVSFARR